MYTVGATIKTSNSVVNQLAAGATLRVTSKGTMVITSIPKPTFKFGDRVWTKYGAGTVSRPSSRLSVSGAAGKVFYIADNDPVLRIADAADLALL